MRIVRYRLGEKERSAIRAIADRIARVTPDAPLATTDDFSHGVATVSLSDSETGYTLELGRESWGGNALAGLKDSLAQLTCDPKLSPVVVIENLPIESNPAALPLLVGSLVGEVREYHRHGAPVVAISHKEKKDALRPSSDNNLEFKLHTDLSFYARPPAFVAFLMLQPATIGGESTFCDPMPVIDRLPPHIAEQLEKPFRFPAPIHVPLGNPQLFPILDHDEDGVLRIRYRGDGLSAGNVDQAHALAIWERDISAFEVEVPLERGEMAIFSNTRLLHGRREFRDANGNPKRLALRAYLEPRSSVVSKFQSNINAL